MTAARMHVVFDIPTDKYTGLIIDLKKVDIFYFQILPTPDLGWHGKFERLFIVLGRWTLAAGPKYLTFHLFEKAILLNS